MMKVSNLSITTHKGRVLLKDFSFTLNKKDKVALIGEEGNGKSTILKILAGIDVSDYVSFSGSIICSERIGYLAQRIESRYSDYEALKYICEDEVDYSLLFSLISELGIDSSLIFDRIIHTLSGGEKVKISLLRLLYQQPDILLLDEPTNDLDLKTLIWLEEFIKSCDKPLIFISHDETLLENCSTSILHLEQLKKKSESRITYSGVGYHEYTQERQHFLNRNNMIAAKEKSELNKQIEKWRKIYQKVDNAQRSISRGNPSGGRLLKKKMHAVKSLERNLKEKKENLTEKYEPEEAINVFFNDVDINPNKIILELVDKKVEIENRLLVEPFDLTVVGSDKICLIGDNGSGKSTLIKEIYLLLKTRDDIKLGYMPQNYQEVMDYQLTPVEYLLENQEYEKRGFIQSCLGAMKITTEEMEHKIEALSEGQKAKILILKLIINNYNVLIMDEPTRNLSPLSNPKIREILIDYKGCLIAVSHDRKFINEVCNKVYQIEDKKLKKLD